MKLKSAFLGVAMAIGGAGAVAACPNYSLSGETYYLTGYDLWNVQSVGVTAGGEYSIQGCGIRPRTDQGRGYVTAAPDFTISLSQMNQFSLVVSVVSECDSVLLINTGAANWYYDDDDNGNLDARISLNRPSNGWMDIWVGTNDGAYCNATLNLETFER